MKKKNQAVKYKKSTSQTLSQTQDILSKDRQNRNSTVSQHLIDQQTNYTPQSTANIKPQPLTALPNITQTPLDKVSAQTLKTEEKEPSPEELAEEANRFADDLQSPSTNKKISSQAGTDLLTSYIHQLSQIPLFLPEEELKQAKLLEKLDNHFWYLLLNTPKVLVHLLQLDENLPPSLRDECQQMLEYFRKTASRSKASKPAITPYWQEQCEKLANRFRKFDQDKILTEKVLECIRKEVWSRQVIPSSQMFRITHADLTILEKARGNALRCRNHFVRSNLRLVVSVARNFHHYRIPFIDLIQEGNMGLMKAVHRYDPHKGFRFSTYAHWWIRQAIERAIINKANQVRLPVHIVDSRRQLQKAINQLTQNLGRQPTPKEVAESTDLSPKKVEQLMWSIQPDPISLDEKMNSEDSRKFSDIVADETVPLVDEFLIRENTHAHLKELLHLLNPIEKDIITRRFGLGVEAEQTLDEIGENCDLSRERVRQLQTQALTKIRRMCQRRGIY